MQRASLLLLVVSLAFLAFLPRGLVRSATSAPHLDHVFVIILENHDYCQLLAAPASAVPGECATGDNPNPAHDAPFLNKLAAANGVATAYFGTSHPSEPNYISMVGGNYFGIQDDDDYTCPNGPAPNSVGCIGGNDLNNQNSTCNCDAINYPNHTIYGDNLAQQLDNRGVSWKGYFQGLPSVGYTGNCSPGLHGDCFYASKHNPFINFATVQDHDLSKMVPIEQFSDDLQTHKVPRLSVLVPDQCNDMHGQGKCTTSNIATGSCTVPGGCNLPCTDDPGCIQDGDAYTKLLVDTIRDSQTWKEGNNAIIITVDEGNTNLGCCDAATKDGQSGGGGNVATIVVTNHEVRQGDENNNQHGNQEDNQTGNQGKGHGGFADSTPYNHYSLLATLEQVFGLGCVQNACDAVHVKPMTPLLRAP
jgi:hypothetical protein